MKPTDLNKSAFDMIYKQFLRITQPHLSKMIGANRPSPGPWREDPRPRPLKRHFDPMEKLHQQRKSWKEEKIFDDKHKTITKINQKSDIDDLRHTYKILCLDGGGVRGILTTNLLSRIVEHNPKFMDDIDLICGTSAGGILALLLAGGYTPKECNEIYSFAAPHIFAHNPWRAINPFRAKYSDLAKQELFQYYFGERKMIDLEKQCAVISFRLDGRKSQTHSFFNREGWRPAIFSNMPKSAGQVEPDNDLHVWDACMRTSAAPTFFPVFKGYTDGGIVANNPSILAVAKAMAHHPTVTPRNVAVLSLGAGTYPRHTNVFSSATARDQVDILGQTKTIGRADWGIKQWIPFLLDLLLDGDSVTTEMVMYYLLGSNGMYHRLEPMLPCQVALDDTTSMEMLAKYAYEVDLTETLKFVDKKFGNEDMHADDTAGYNSLDNSSQYADAWERTVDHI